MSRQRQVRYGGNIAMLKSWVPQPLRPFLRKAVKRWRDSRGVACFGNEGEDIILSKLFAAELGDPGFAGFYVDVGAFHPRRASNTYYFYKRGWSGINIDAMPGSMREFHRARPRDVNLEAAISDNPENLEYSAFEEPSYNGFLSEALRQQLIESGVKLLWTKPLATRRLDDILAEYLPAGQSIHFLSVDVEGHDLAVLRSMNWERLRPRVVVVELWVPFVNDVFAHAVHQYLAGLGYLLYSKLCNSCIYVSDGKR